MKALITGGLGFIGTEFIGQFLKGQLPLIESVIVLDKITYAANVETLNLIKREVDIEFFQLDISKEREIAPYLKGVDCVINFAAESHVDRSISNPGAFIDTNLVGVLNLLDSINDMNSKIRFLQISTDEVYGSILDGHWDESRNLEPSSPYSASKASADLLCLAYVKTYNMDIVITRCCNNYGEYQHPEKMIPKIILNAKKNIPIPVYGSGKNIREWIHVSDHVQGIYLALINGKAGEVYNIGSGNELSNLDLTRLILQVMGKELVPINYVIDRPGHDFRYAIDYSKARNQLGFQALTVFSKGIESTIEWYLSHEYPNP